MKKLLLALILMGGALMASPFTATYSGNTLGRVTVNNPTATNQLFQWSYVYDTLYLDGRPNPGPYTSPVISGSAYVPPGTWPILFDGGEVNPGVWRTDIRDIIVTTVWQGQTNIAHFIPLPGQAYILFIPAQTITLNPQQAQPVSEIPEPALMGVVGLGLVLVARRYKWKS